MLEYYCIPEYKDVEEFLVHLANRMGKLKKGGIPDTEAAARSVLRDWNTSVHSLAMHVPVMSTTPLPVCMHTHTMYMTTHTHTHTHFETFFTLVAGVALNFTHTPLKSGHCQAMYQPT